MVNIQKASAYSPWNPCFKIKEESIVNVGGQNKYQKSIK